MTDFALLPAAKRRLIIEQVATRRGIARRQVGCKCCPLDHRLGDEMEKVKIRSRERYLYWSQDEN